MASSTVQPRASRASDARPNMKTESQTALVWRRFRKHRLAVISMVLLTLIFLLSLFAPLVAPFKIDHLDPTYKFVPFMTVYKPTGQVYIFGSDQLGRDLLTRLLYGARVTLSVAVLVASLSCAVGALIGAVAGYYRGIIDTALMRVLDFTSGIPDLPVLLILASILLTDPKLLPLPDFVTRIFEALLLVREREARSVVVIVLVLTILGWTGVARLTRGMVLAVREADYVTASRSLGMGDTSLILRHIMPNVLAPIIVAFTQSLAGAFAAETALSFLGFGVQEPAATWGNMMSIAQNNIFENRVMPLVVGLPILICSLAFNFIGDGLRDALDPRLKM